MYYIIKSNWIEKYMADAVFKQALIDEVQLYVDTYYSGYSLKVCGDWQLDIPKNECYENEKIETWVMDLLKVF